jgi:hypothetical protein
MGLQYRIQYKAGSTNTVADALSRCESEFLGAVSVCSPSWQENVALTYHDNDEDKQLLIALSLPEPHSGGFSLVDGLIRYKSRIWLGHNKLTQQYVLQALHASGIGHSGIQGMYQHVKSLFAWPKLKHSVTTYVQSCEVCQQAKVEHVKLPGLL